MAGLFCREGNGRFLASFELFRASFALLLVGSGFASVSVVWLAGVGLGSWIVGFGVCWMLGRIAGCCVGCCCRLGLFGPSTLWPHPSTSR